MRNRKGCSHIVTLPQRVGHCLGLGHLHHHLVEPGKEIVTEVIIGVFLVLMLSHTQDLGLACLDVWTLATLFCLNYFAANNVGYKYLFLLSSKTINGELLENSSTTQYHSFIRTFLSFCCDATFRSDSF